MERPRTDGSVRPRCPGRAVHRVVGAGGGAVRQDTLQLPGFSLPDMVSMSIETVQQYEPKDKPYHGCFSGGKDSVVLKEIVRLSGVKVKWIYNVTTIDPPELVYFIRREHPDVKFQRPKHNFFHYFDKHGVPTRRVRWCCEKFKETANAVGSILLLGIRAAESPRRKAAWKVATMHHRTKTTAICPILYWTDEQVWRFIHENNLPYCSLYDEGFKRLGCIGCPMAGKRRAEDFKRWPRYEQMWKRGVKKAWEYRKDRDNNRFASWEEMWNWWMSDKSVSSDECDGQLMLW